MERAQHLESVGILAGGLAHDFNNVLSAVSGYITLTLSEEGVQETGRIRLQQMADALKKGAALVSRLMEFSRPHESQIRSVHINEVVTAAIELTRPLVKNGVQVKAELSDNLPAVQADPLKLEQVLVNLILNSLDAMPEGGELIFGTGLVRQHTFGRTTEEDKDFVLIDVADTGIGIPDDIQRNIFDPFFTTKRESKGVGLGLSSAQEIVRQHKGHIDLHSAPGAGTKFSVYLPVRG
jgi:signal transduction histidine kinase